MFSNGQEAKKAGGRVQLSEGGGVVGGVGGVGPGNQVMIPVTLSTTCKSCREEVYGTQRLLLSNCNF